MDKFYMTYSGRTYAQEIIPWVEENNVPIMTNAKNRWSDAKQDFLDPWEYNTERCIDSGGFNSQGDYVDRWGNETAPSEEIASELESDTPFFPWDVEEYHEWLSENTEHFEWAACMDYACEERFDTLWSVEERVEATIENTLEQFRMDPDYMLVPVLQGRTVDDYVYCYERLRDADVDVQLDHVGIGTVCRLSSEKRIVEIEEELRERLPDGTTLHGFGVKINAFKMGASFDTADSHAWIAEPKRGRVALLEHDDDNGGIRMDGHDMKDSPRTRTLETFKTYYAYVSHIRDGESDVSVDNIIDGQKDLP